MLVVLTTIMIYLAATESQTLIRVGCGVAALILASAALFQSRPVRAPEDPITEDDL